ncbi:MAG: GvpL/GvpF family gas vesicle protein [Candidatus Omnitrophica bacterium]|nr:GvpL/GvpF family gas vesicle protein [Candidatus Omnitrophota bacterium]
MGVTMNGEGRYLYGIIESAKRIEFGPVGLPGGDPMVYTIHHRDLGACVSGYPPQREIRADAEHCLAHERVLEAIMQRFTILPFEFGTVAPTEAEVVKLLSRHRNGIKLALRRLHGRVEVGVKAFWKSLQAAALEVAKEHTAIARYRREIASKPPEETYQDRIQLGEMVAVALGEKRKREANSLAGTLKRVAADVSQGATVGDTMVLNAAFLIRKADFPRFEQTLKALGKRLDGRLDFKYSGPLPPYSFTGLSLRV